MKTIPILFSTAMVQALLDGRKTQTRRAVRIDLSDCYYQSLVNHATGWHSFVPNGNYNPSETDVIEVKCPYGQPGDVLWVRETFSPISVATKNGLIAEFIYRADAVLPVEEGDFYDIPWKPSIFMPKAAARIFLKVVSVRVERLQDISEADAVAEGVKICPNMNQRPGSIGYVWPNSPYDNSGLCHSMASTAFNEGWEIINGRESWDANPWVWVVEFERCEKPENF